MKKPTVVFSRKDTLHAPNFKNVGEHLIHSVDKQDEGAASPAPMSPSPNEAEVEPAPQQEQRSFSCLRAIFCCCKRNRGHEETYAPAPNSDNAEGDVAPASSGWGSLGFRHWKANPHWFWIWTKLW